MVESGIYIIQNKITNKIYVGSSVNLKSRRKEHFNSLKKNEHHNIHLQRVYNKYKRIFRFKIIEEVKNKNNLIKREQFWIDHYDSCKNGYNICPIAGSSLGIKHTEKAKRRMALAQKGRKHTDSAKRKMSLNGGHNKGKKMPLGFKIKMSKITKGKNNGMYNKQHSDIAKKNISIKLQQRGGHEGKNNPNYGHEWTGKQKKHMQDSLISRGGYKGKNNPNYGHTKIKQSDWGKIICLIEKKKEKVSFLADYYNVSLQTIYNILKKREDYVQTN